MDTGIETALEEIQEAQSTKQQAELEGGTQEELDFKRKEKAMRELVEAAAKKKLAYQETPLGILGDRNITDALLTGKVTEEQAEQIRAEDEEIQFNRRMYDLQQREKIYAYHGIDPELAKGQDWYFSADFYRLQNQLPEDQRMSLEERKQKEARLEELTKENIAQATKPITSWYETPQYTAIKQAQAKAAAGETAQYDQILNEIRNLAPSPVETKIDNQTVTHAKGMETHAPPAALPSVEPSSQAISSTSPSSSPVAK